MTKRDRCGVSLYYPNNIIGKESVCTNCFRKEKEKMFEDAEQIKETVSKEVKRDLKADLDLCNEVGSHLENTLIEWDGKIVLNAGIPGENIHQLSQDQYMLIIRACEGWPHAIERAIKAESLAWELVGALEMVFNLLEHHQPIWYIWAHFHQINNALGSYKEVLGDE